MLLGNKDHVHSSFGGKTFAIGTILGVVQVAKLDWPSAS
jgi:hypothetical protein